MDRDTSGFGSKPPGDLFRPELSGLALAFDEYHLPLPANGKVRSPFIDRSLFVRTGIDEGNVIFPAPFQNGFMQFRHLILYSIVLEWLAIFLSPVPLQANLHCLKRCRIDPHDGGNCIWQSLREMHDFRTTFY